MRSPKFRYTLDELKSCIDPIIVETVWKKTVGAQLRKQIVVDLCEFRDYRPRISEIGFEVSREVYTGEYKTRPTRHYLIEKSRGLCRQLTIAAPRDLIVLQCLSNRLYQQLKASQPTKRAYFEPGDGKFNKDGALIVRDLDLTLQSRQLRLNSSKTKILRISDGEAARHFCIHENRFLDYAARFLRSGSPIANLSIRKALEKVYKLWRGGSKFERSRFLEGNGEKVFKYLVGLMRRVGLQPPSDDLLWLIQNVPGLRETCFNALTYVPNPVRELGRLTRMFRIGLFVDDAACLHMANFLVHARFSRKAATTSAIRHFAEYLLDDGGYFKAIAATTIASKFLEAEPLMRIVRHTYPVWSQDLWMGRAIAGLSPLVATKKKLAREFADLGRRANNPEWESVFNYHESLRHDLAAVKDATAYAQHGNPSFAYAIYHPKALTILSMKQNKGASSQYKAVLAKQPSLLGDPYYRPLFK